MVVAMSQPFDGLTPSFETDSHCQELSVSRDIFDIRCPSPPPLDELSDGFTSSNSSSSSFPELDFMEPERMERRPSLLKTGKGRTPFPRLLHHMLETVEEHGHSDIVSWQPHGKCFVVHKPKEFVIHIMPRLFRQTKWSSFQRQLNLYGFNRITEGPDKGGYFHFLFVRGKPGLCDSIIRTKIKGTRVRRASNPQNEPNFYAMSDMEYEMHRRKSLDGMARAARRASMPQFSSRERSLQQQQERSFELKKPFEDQERPFFPSDAKPQSMVEERVQQDVEPMDATEDCLNLPDDPKILQEIFKLMGKPFSLDDLDELPEDDDGWGTLLNAVAE